MLVNEAIRFGPDSLADELWQKILCQVCLTDVLNCARVDKRLRSLSHNDSVWRCLYLKEFDASCCPRVGQTCRDAFQER